MKMIGFMSDVQEKVNVEETVTKEPEEQFSEMENGSKNSKIQELKAYGKIFIDGLDMIARWLGWMILILSMIQGVKNLFVKKKE